MSLEQAVAGILERQTDRFYGKYRGLVFANVDPQNQGRLKAIVPEVLGVFPSNWCLPCTPYAGNMAGLFTIPLPGSGVWVEFEAGDVNRPVWTGCWWGTAEIPVNEAGSPAQFTSKIFRTDTGLILSLDDTAQSITIQDSQQMNSFSMKVGFTKIDTKLVMTLNAQTILHGQNAAHPAVFGDQLLQFLNIFVLAFNTHTHPGETAIGVLPVTPFPPFPQVAPATPAMLSTKNLVE